jgi:hypothetical protein
MENWSVMAFFIPLLIRISKACPRWTNTLRSRLSALLAQSKGIGSTIADLNKCAKCGAHTGAQRRFRKALRTALSAKEAKGLTAVYNLRSKTAHSGILHGGEAHMGNIFTPMSSFGVMPRSFEFRYQTLWKVQAASKRVLIANLTE